MITPEIDNAPWISALLVATVILSCIHVRSAKAGEALAIGGSLRNVTAGIDNYAVGSLYGSSDADGLSQSILRLTITGDPLPWLSCELHAVQSFDVLTSAGTGESGTSVFDLGAHASRYRTVSGVREWLRSTDHGTAAALWIDRLNVRLNLRYADLTIGRQAITFGKAYFWNPLDLFLAFDPRQFDRDYKPGVDALRIDIPAGDFSGVTIVGAPGREIDAFGGFVDDSGWDASWYGSALISRIYASTGGWDMAFQGGKVYGGYQLGGGTVGEAGPVEVRGEAAYTIAGEGRQLPSGLSGNLIEDHLTAVVGLGHRFQNTFTLEGEYLYNGAGDPDDLEASLIRFGSGESFHLGLHLAGLSGSYEILPVLVGQIGSLVSFSDGSGQVQPGLSYSAADEVDLLAGALINFGDRPAPESVSGQELRSEFGTFPDVYYVEFKVYF